MQSIPSQGLRSCTPRGTAKNNSSYILHTGTQGDSQTPYSKFCLSCKDWHFKSTVKVNFMTVIDRIYEIWNTFT